MASKFAPSVGGERRSSARWIEIMDYSCFRASTSWLSSKKYTYSAPPSAWRGQDIVPGVRTLPSFDDAVRGSFVSSSQSSKNGAGPWGGRVVLSTNGQDIRNPVTGRKFHVTGVYPSRKAGRSVRHESMHELAFIQISEVDPGVVDYRTQYLRFEFLIDGRLRTYIPDAVRLLSSGSIEVIEVKRDVSGLRDPEYKLKIQEAGRICQTLGWRFDVVMGLDLKAGNAFSANVQYVQSRRHTPVSQAEQFHVHELVWQEGGRAPLGKITEALGGGVIGLAKAASLMCRRRLSIDLVAPLVADTCVHAVSHTQH